MRLKKVLLARKRPSRTMDFVLRSVETKSGIAGRQPMVEQTDQRIVIIHWFIEVAE
jgi:hypothetical protein